MNKYPFLYFLAITMLSCQTQKNIAGVYSAKKNVNKFEFFSDSTFIYHQSITIDSDGTWSRIDNNSIILNSRIKNKLLPVYIEKNISDKDKKQICTNLLINITYYTDQDYYVIPYINGRAHLELSKNPADIDLREMKVPLKEIGNYCFIPDKSVESLYFKIKTHPQRAMYLGRGQPPTYYTLQTEEVNITMQPNETVVVNIALNDSLFSYRIFDNEVLKIKNKKLIFEDREENNKENTLYWSK